MLTLQGKSDKLVIVVHEIYGINQHMISLCESLSKLDVDVICPNLLDQDSSFDYAQEEEAYHYFMDKIGIAQAVKKVENVVLSVQDKYSKIMIIGFSVGATVAWLCSENEHIDGVVGYYGSRIRDYQLMHPKCPTLLIFPKEEKSFNLNELVYSLSKLEVTVHLYEGEHGFGDPYSPKYNEQSSNRALAKTMTFLEENGFFAL